MEKQEEEEQEEEEEEEEEERSMTKTCHNRHSSLVGSVWLI
jgi:hypothetical protein